MALAFLSPRQRSATLPLRARRAVPAPRRPPPELMVTAPSSTVPIAPLERLRTYASFVRFEHTLFSLPLILAGVFSEPGPPLTALRWGLISLAAVGARTAAM